MENDSATDIDNDIDNGIENDNNEIENSTKNDIQSDRKEQGPLCAQWSTGTHETENACLKAYDKMTAEIENT